jgi:hypothetical protein
MLPGRTSRITGPLLAAWAIFATYAIAARGVRNFFPLSVFDMYQRAAPAAASRVIVLDGGGNQHEVSAFAGFHCEPAPPVLPDVRRFCGSDHQPLDYVMRDQQRDLDAHLASAPGPLAIAIVSRSYRVDANEVGITSRDCVLARCTAHWRREPR